MSPQARLPRYARERNIQTGSIHLILQTVDESPQPDYPRTQGRTHVVGE